MTLEAPFTSLNYEEGNGFWACDGLDFECFIEVHVLKFWSAERYHREMVEPLIGVA